MRIKLTIAYDGSRFSGWQTQSRGETIQSLIESAASEIERCTVRIHGAGRTDSGVHALGQVAHFDITQSKLPAIAWPRALNAHLPPQVRILRASRVSDDFHARYSARGKIYRYEIHTGPVLPPHLFQRAWHIPQPVDHALLRRTASLFQGRHDFHSFAANRSTPVRDTVREIRAVRVRRKGHATTLEFEGAGFLYKMVRMLVGASTRVALGKVPIDDIQRRLSGRSLPRWNHVAPADGLFLVRVLY